MNTFLLGIKSALRQKKSSFILSFIAALTAVMLSVSFLVVNACNIAKDVVELPNPDYYSVIPDRTQLSSEYGYDSVDSIPCGSWSEAQMVHRYFLNITDYTAELSSYLSSSINTVVPPDMSDYNSFTVYGINRCMDITAFIEGELTLTEGRLLERSDRDNKKSVCLISAEAAEKNDVKVGDSIELKTDTEFVKYTVVGIYKDNIRRAAVSDTRLYQGNYIYVPLSFYEQNETPYSVSCSNYRIKLDSESHVKPVEKLMNEYRMCGGFPLKLLRVSDLHAAQTKGIDALLSVFRIIIAVCVISVAAILCMLIYSVVNSRSREIGIYISLGKKKSGVVATILIEILFAVLIGVCVGSFVGGAFGLDFSDSFINSAVSDMAPDALYSTTPDTIRAEDEKTETVFRLVQDGVVTRSVALAAAITFVITLLSSIGVAVNVLRFKPIGIITRNEGQL